ncbi:uncharacterized protein LOC131321384 [Rhododendron vialii]|uniref:uncharacterized protein LOC131321384 n=1 Tax=Rhododendron vialii TaxID=182163 RepID=UPI00265F6849|nr:uncharacterized protein LOC131321384 [Rhododendron vialii]
MTEKAKRISFAKICVEVDVSFDLPHSIDLLTASRKVIGVKYPWEAYQNAANGSAPTASVASVIPPEIILPCATDPAVSVITPAAPQIILSCANKFTALREGEDVSVAISNDDNVVLLVSPTIKDEIEDVQCNATVFDILESSRNAEEVSVFDFLPDELGVGMSDPSMEKGSNKKKEGRNFNAIVSKEKGSNEKQGGKNPRAAKRERKSKRRLLFLWKKGAIRRNKGDFKAIVSMEKGSNKKQGGKNPGVPKRERKSKRRQENLDSTTKKSLPSAWNYVHNIGSRNVARIIVAWDSQDTQVRVLFTSQQLILLLVVMDQKTFAISVVYGFNQASARRILWDDLRASMGSVGCQPWIVLGDFNAVRWQNEKSNSNSFDNASAGDFNQCIEDIGVEQLNSTGLWFTWSNKRLGHDHSSNRIDRALVNSLWQAEFTKSEAAVLVPGVSDHCPIIVAILPYKGGRKPFKFFNFWMNHKEFSSILSQSWSALMEYVSSPMLLLYNKMRRLKPVLRGLNKEFYSDIQKRVLVAREELTAIQTRCANSISDPILLAYEKFCLLQLNELSITEEDWCRQKSRVQWLKLGDNNTRFFNQKMNSH